MYHKEGIVSFFSGFWPSMFMSLYGIIMMVAYEQLKSFCVAFAQTHQLKRREGLESFLIGGLSKSLASFTLHPMNTVRSRLQQKREHLDESNKRSIRLGGERLRETREAVMYSGFIDCMKKTYKHEGLGAFYKGLGVNLGRLFPQSGLFFLVYDRVQRGYDRMYL